jgi:hypothetical protein
MTDFKKLTFCHMPFDMRNEDPEKNYGICGIDVKWVLVGPLGAVQFNCFWDIHLPHIEKEERPKWSNFRDSPFCRWLNSFL